MSTSSGFWNPLIFSVLITVLSIILYLLYLQGRKEYKKGSEQIMPYLSGNIEYDNKILRVKASNLYWGFVKTFNPYYKGLSIIHTENINDHMLSLIIILVSIFFILTKI